MPKLSGTLKYANNLSKLDTKYKPAYKIELQIDKNGVAALKKEGVDHLVRKNGDGEMIVKIKRKEEYGVVDVVDAKLNPVDARIVGNGSKVNVIYGVSDYNGEPSGLYMNKIQVVDLIKFEPKPGEDFDVVEGSDVSNEDFEEFEI